MGLLRGTPHRERAPRHPPRLGPAVQGPVPALPHHAGPLRRPQGRVGLPRPARGGRGREGARVLGQGADRGRRHRGVQRQVPGVGAALRGRLRGPHPPHRHVARRRRCVLDDVESLHRERLVVLRPDVGERGHRRGLQGRPLLRPLRHRAVEPRARPARGVPRRHRGVGVRPLPGARGRLRPPGVDHHAVDAAVEHGGRGRARPRVRPGRPSGASRRRDGRVTGRGRARARRRDRGTDPRRRPRRPPLRAALRPAPPRSGDRGPLPGRRRRSRPAARRAWRCRGG